MSTSLQANTLYELRLNGVQSSPLYCLVDAKGQWALSTASGSFKFALVKYDSSTKQPLTSFTGALKANDEVVVADVSRQRFATIHVPAMNTFVFKPWTATAGVVFTLYGASETQFVLEPPTAHFMRTQPVSASMQSNIWGTLGLVNGTQIPGSAFFSVTSTKNCPSKCAGYQECVGGQCVGIACTSPSDCPTPPGYPCIKGHCAAPIKCPNCPGSQCSCNPMTGKCESRAAVPCKDKCATGETCQWGTCVTNAPNRPTDCPNPRAKTMGNWTYNAVSGKCELRAGCTNCGANESCICDHCVPTPCVDGTAQGCPTGYICTKGQCVKSALPPTKCSSDKDCPGQQVCKNGVCVNPVNPPTPHPSACSAKNPCKDGYICSDGKCVPKPIDNTYIYVGGAVAAVVAMLFIFRSE